MSNLHGHVADPGKRVFHVESQDFALYVIDGLAPARALLVEDHVAACEACAAALAREAQVELAMELLASAPAVTSAPVRSIGERSHASPRPSAVPARRVARLAGGVAASLAAAAVVALFLAPGSREGTEGDVARYGAVSADAAGAIVAFDTKPRGADALDGG